MALSTMPVAELLDAFSSPAPTPGGGSASALAGAIGAALLAMVAGMSKTKSGTPDDRAALDAARARLLVVRDALRDLIDRDAASYEAVVAAFRQPKATDEEKASRKAAIQAATLHATEVPLETMRRCAEALHDARTVGDLGNPSAASDVKVGTSLLMSGLSGARENVEINLPGLADAAVARKIADDVAGLVRQIGASAPPAPA